MDVVGVAHDAPHVDDLAGHRLVERVEGLGPIQRDGGDVVVADLEGDRRVVTHVRSSVPGAGKRGYRFLSRAAIPAPGQWRP